MNLRDKEMLSNVRAYVPTLSKVNKVDFHDNNKFVGLGWSHNLNENGIWGRQTSNLLFK